MTIARRLGLQAIALATLTAAGAARRRASRRQLPQQAHQADRALAAGGSTDVARVLAEGLRSTLGQPSWWTTAPAPAAGGHRGRGPALADGYTVGMATVSTMTINPCCTAPPACPPSWRRWPAW
jgi:tripartite-type tricarboxylate transporter receptor subunit TctC